MRSLLQRKMLLASVIFIAVLPILASASFITYRSFQQAKLDAVDRAKTLLSHVTERQKQLIVQTLQSLRILTQLPDILAGKRECSLFLRKFIERNPYYVNAGLVDAKGNIICSAQEPKHKINVSQREWFNMAMKTQVGQIGGLQFGLITGKPSIVAALPIVEENLVTHVLYLSISVSWLEDVFAEYSLPEKSQITALDSHGLVLFQHPQKVENEPSLLGKEFPSQKVWNHIKGSGENIVPARIYEDGGRYVYTFQRIEAEDRVAMVIALRFIESEIYRQATRDGIALVLGLLLSLLSTLIIAYVAGNYLFLKPVAEEIDKLHDVAETDELTQVLNRRGFVRLFKEKLEEEASNDYHALLLIDLDHFKNVNDTYGHSAGDAVLKETATRIRAALRENEIFGRIGGEEFAIFIPQVTRENAVLLAERVRVVVSGLPYKLESASIPVTLSVGVCHATGRTPLEKFLERADKALYKSKRTGRNKVTI